MKHLDTDAIPAELKDRPQWVVWRLQTRDGKPTKVPFSPTTGEAASSTDPATWATFKQAVEAAARRGFAGIGFVFTASDPYVGIDLDKCTDPDGTVQDWATDIIQQLNSYTEISPSGLGAHIIVKGSLPPGPRRKGAIEMYSEGRYFTMTGDAWEGLPTTPQERTTQLAALHARLFNAPTPMNGNPPRPVTTALPDDAALIERARAARNGVDFDRLWRGDWRGAGFDSQSEADLKLCNTLAFWTGGDEARIDRLFQQSGLMRDKWHERHYNDGRTYGQATIAKAVTGTSNHFGDRPIPPVLTLASNGKAAPTPEATPLPPPAASVPALPDSATAIYAHAAPCARWLDDYIDFALAASPMTPRSFHETAGLFAASVAIARRLVLRVSFTSIYPNVFALFIAPSTLYSKTTGLKLLNDLFHAADMEHYLLPQRMTPEAMLQELSLGVPVNLNLGDVEARRQWERERAFAARRGWAIDEASGLFDSLKRDFNTGLLPMLLNLYECPDRMTEQTIGRWRVTVHNACVSFYGAATPAAMSEHFANNAFWSNGLWARFALVTPDQPPQFQFFPDAMQIPSSVSQGLRRMADLFPTPTARLVDIEESDGTKRKVVEVSNEVEAASVVLAPGVWDAWEAYTRATRYELLQGDVNEELLYASYGRLGTHVIKVAMVLATMDAAALPVTVELRHYARAQQIVETWRASLHRLRTLGANTEEERQTDRILETLNKAGEAGCPTRDIYKPLHLTATDGRRLLDELARQGLAECIYITAANGRKVEKWRRAFSLENSPIVPNV